MVKRLTSHGKYYHEDSEQRKGYFDAQFVSLANNLAQQQGLTLSSFLKDLRNFTSFKNYLEAVFNLDTSLGEYFKGMSNDEKREFYERSIIQDVVDANIEDDEEQIDEIPAPVYVKQVEKKTRKYYDAKIKGRRTRGYEDSFKVRGKEVTRYRDARGRFVKKI